MTTILQTTNVTNQYSSRVQVFTARQGINVEIETDEPIGIMETKSSTELLECLSEINDQNKAAIMMAALDPFAASYCRRILFIKDGRLFTKLVKAATRQEFFRKIQEVLAALGGDSNEFIQSGF